MLKMLASAFAGAALTAAAWLAIPADAQTAPDPQPETTRGIEDKAWIGVDYQADATGAWALSHVHVGSPAWNAGLLKGDTIVAIEVLIDGKPVDTASQPGTTSPMLGILAVALNTAPPGTEFRLKIKRGNESKATEKAIAVDMPREKVDLPAARHFITHIRKMHETWKQADYFWETIKSASYRQFSDVQARQLQGEIARLQVQKLQGQLADASEKRRLIQEQIKLAIQQRNLAAAQEQLALLQQNEAELNIIGSIVGLVLKFLI